MAKEIYEFMEKEIFTEHVNISTVYICISTFKSIQWFFTDKKYLKHDNRKGKNKNSFTSTCIF